ncbi:MAG: DUF86 domain-containing protein [Anaerolineaceae bacterium]|nr:DUF86 domain-containing protein [Anaerolineaceae bacterium]
MRSEQKRLLDCLDAIEKIQQKLPIDRAEFEQDEMVQVWVTHHLQIIGEAAGRLSVRTRNSSDEIPWAQIIGKRNILIHDYFGINLDIIWSTAVSFLPELRMSIEKLIEDLEN